MKPSPAVAVVHSLRYTLRRLLFWVALTVLFLTWYSYAEGQLEVTLLGSILLGVPLGLAIWALAEFFGFLFPRR